MDSAAVFDLYLQLAPAELFRLLQRQMGVIVHNGIYSARVVLWMMINQRLHAQGTLASSVEQLVQGRFDSLLSRCKRVQKKKIALSTGGYCQARQHLPKLLVSRSMDELIERLRSRLLESGSPLPQRVYLWQKITLLTQGLRVLLIHEQRRQSPRYPDGSDSILR